MYFTKRPSISFHYDSSNEDGIKEDETASTFTANMTSQASSLSLDSEGKETMKRMEQMNNQLLLPRSRSREEPIQYIPRQISTVQVQKTITEQGHLAEKMSKMSELNIYAMSSLQKQISAMKSQLEQIPSMMNAQLQRQILPSVHYEMNKRFELEQKKSEHLERWVTMMASELGYEDWTPSIANFVYNIKNITSQMRRGELVNQSIYLNGCYSTTDDSNEVILRYDDQFIPYWKTFTDALQHTKIDFDASSNNRSHFAIHNIQLSSTILAMIALALQGKKIDIFRLWGNEYKSISDGIDFAIDVIQNNEIKDFQWVNTTIDNMVHVTRLLEVLSTHQSLERIRLENCCNNAKGVDGYSILCSIIIEHAHILGINLDSNMIRPMGTHLTHFLTTNPPLNELSLQGNLLDDDDARLIANALKHNSNLRKLHLDGNKITNVGCTAIGSVLFDRSSLNSAATSNHTCMVSGIELEECTNNKYDLPERNKHLKIYALLSVDKDDSKVRELGDSEDFERRRNFLQVSGLNTSGPSKSLQSVTMRRKRADSSSWNLGSTDSSTVISTTSTSDGSNDNAVYVFKNEMQSSSPQTSALMSRDSDSSVSSSSSYADEEYARQNSSCSDFCSCNQVGSRSISHSVGCRRSLFFTQDVGIDISSRSAQAQTWQHFCFRDSLDLEDKEDSSSLPGDCDTATWTKQDSLALLGQGRVRI